MNKQLGNGQTKQAISDYKHATRGKGRASDCIACGHCENACPQHLSIIKYLEQTATQLEK